MTIIIANDSNDPMPLTPKTSAMASMAPSTPRQPKSFLLSPRTPTSPRTATSNDNDKQSRFVRKKAPMPKRLNPLAGEEEILTDREAAHEHQASLTKPSAVPTVKPSDDSTSGNVEIPHAFKPCSTLPLFTSSLEVEKDQNQQHDFQQHQDQPQDQLAKSVEKLGAVKAYLEAPEHMESWIETYETEKHDFASFALFTEMKLDEIHQYTQLVGSPNIVQAAACCASLWKMPGIMGCYRSLLEKIATGIMSVMYAPEAGMTSSSGNYFPSAAVISSLASGSMTALVRFFYHQQPYFVRVQELQRELQRARNLEDISVFQRLTPPQVAAFLTQVPFQVLAKGMLKDLDPTLRAEILRTLQEKGNLAGKTRQFGGAAGAATTWYRKYRRMTRLKTKRKVDSSDDDHSSDEELEQDERARLAELTSSQICRAITINGCNFSTSGKEMLLCAILEEMEYESFKEVYIRFDSATKAAFLQYVSMTESSPHLRSILVHLPSAGETLYRLLVHTFDTGRNWSNAIGCTFDEANTKEKENKKYFYQRLLSSEMDSTFLNDLSMFITEDQMEFLKREYRRVVKMRERQKAIQRAIVAAASGPKSRNDANGGESTEATSEDPDPSVCFPPSMMDFTTSSFHQHYGILDDDDEEEGNTSEETIRRTYLGFTMESFQASIADYIKQNRVTSNGIYSWLQNLLLPLLHENEVLLVLENMIERLPLDIQRNRICQWLDDLNADETKDDKRFRKQLTFHMLSSFGDDDTQIMIDKIQKKIQQQQSARSSMSSNYGFCASPDLSSSPNSRNSSRPDTGSSSFVGGEMTDEALRRQEVIAATMNLEPARMLQHMTHDLRLKWIETITESLSREKEMSLLKWKHVLKSVWNLIENECRAGRSSSVTPTHRPVKVLNAAQAEREIQPLLAQLNQTEKSKVLAKLSSPPTPQPSPHADTPSSVEKKLGNDFVLPSPETPMTHNQEILSAFKHLLKTKTDTEVLQALRAALMSTPPAKKEDPLQSLQQQQQQESKSPSPKVQQVSPPELTEDESASKTSNKKGKAGKKTDKSKGKTMPASAPHDPKKDVKAAKPTAARSTTGDSDRLHTPSDTSTSDVACQTEPILVKSSRSRDADNDSGGNAVDAQANAEDLSSGGESSQHGYRAGNLTLANLVGISTKIVSKNGKQVQKINSEVVPENVAGLVTSWRMNVEQLGAFTKRALGTVLRLISESYGEMISAARRKNNLIGALGTRGKDLTLVQTVYQSFLHSYGLPEIADMHLLAFSCSLDTYRKQHLRVELFARFCFDEVPEQELLHYLEFLEYIVDSGGAVLAASAAAPAGSTPSAPSVPVINATPQVNNSVNVNTKALNNNVINAINSNAVRIEEGILSGAGIIGARANVGTPMIQQQQQLQRGTAGNRIAKSNPRVQKRIIIPDLENWMISVSEAQEIAMFCFRGMRRVDIMRFCDSLITLAAAGTSFLPKGASFAPKEINANGENDPTNHDGFATDGSGFASLDPSNPLEYMINVDFLLELVILEWREEQSRRETHLLDVFRAGDMNGDGQLTAAEFTQIIWAIDRQRDEGDILLMYSESLRRSQSNCVDKAVFLQVAKENELDKLAWSENGALHNITNNIEELEVTWDQVKNFFVGTLDELGRDLPKNHFLRCCEGPGCGCLKCIVDGFAGFQKMRLAFVQNHAHQLSDPSAGTLIAMAAAATSKEALLPVSATLVWGRFWHLMRQLHEAMSENDGTLFSPWKGSPQINRANPLPPLAPRHLQRRRNALPIFLFPDIDRLFGSVHETDQCDVFDNDSIQARFQNVLEQMVSVNDGTNFMLGKKAKHEEEDHPRK